MKDDSKNTPVEDDQNNYVDTLNGTRKDIGLKLNSSFVKFSKGFVINGALIVAAVVYSPHRWKTCTFAFSLLRQKGIVALTIVLTFLLLKCFGIHLLDEAKCSAPHEHLYTRIHGIWYDLGQYNHPGGPIALSLAKNRDATALFESHHFLSSIDMRKILSKYKVSDSVAQVLTTIDPRDNGGHYVWENYQDDAFVKDMRELLYSYFGAIAERKKCSFYQATKASRERWFFLSALSLGTGSIAPYYVGGQIWTLPIFPVLVWILVANYWHDSLHFSMSQDWTINASLPYILPLISSPWIWMHQHIVGHHSYTNCSRKDPDIAHAPQLKREHQSIEWKEIHKNQGSLLRIALVWSIASNIGLSLLSDYKTNIKLSYNNVVGYNKLSRSRLLLHVVGRMVYLLLLVWPVFVFDQRKAIVWVAVPNIVFSSLFMLNSQINHLTTDCSQASDTNFLKHQVVTAQNFGCDWEYRPVHSLFCFVFSGGLNYQIEHHLFPFVNHCHLPYLAPKVKLCCEKHGVTYKEALGYKEALVHHMHHTMEMAKPPK